MTAKLISIFIKNNAGRLSVIFLLSVCLFPANAAHAQKDNRNMALMEAGVARVDITPQIPIRMAGYAARVSTEADSVLQPISAKALALGSDAQHPSVLITVDLVGIPWRITRQVADFLSQKMGIDPAQIAICASHTHGGPEVGNLINILQYRRGHFSDSLLALDQLIHIAQYTERLTQQLKDVAVAALKNRKPAYVSWGQGQAPFAANRRTKGGPVDLALPMLKITDPDGALRAVFVSYACHGTTLGGNIHKIHGDWISEAQRVIEARHPGATALIALGCAGDANPAPRGTLEDVQQHGKEIADNVDKLLTASLQPLPAPPAGKMKWIKLPFSKTYTVPELIALTKDKTVKGYYARLALERVERGETIPSELDYPVQVWNFDNKMAMVNLAGEVVVDYSIRLKNKYGAERLWINAYSNDVPCYIASRRVIKEGGYEGETSMYWYNKPSPFAPEVEDLIVNAVDELMPPAFRRKRPDIHQERIQKRNGNNYSYLDNARYLQRVQLFAKDSARKNIVMLGNSLTERGHWSDILGRTDVANRGIGSDITPGYIHRIHYVFNLKPEVCFIEGGVNDLAHDIPMNTIVKNLAVLIDTLRHEKIIPVLNAVTFVTRNYHSFDPKKFNHKIKVLNKAIRQLAKRKKVPLIDLNPGISDSGFRLKKYAVKDGIHYTAATYSLWREEITKILKDLDLDK